MRLTTVEEWWPGQRENLRTARIEAWVGSDKLEVGRITAPKDLFEGLRWLVEHAAQMRGLLEAVEHGCDMCCPFCDTHASYGHEDGCEWVEVMDNHA